jgi:hypothetical protein
VTYYPRERDLIRAGLALHAGRLLDQYKRLTQGPDPSDRYEATLTLCVLQTLLTHCWELYMYLGKTAPEIFGTLDPYVNSLLCWPEARLRDTFSTATTKDVIWHLRNALNHPRVQSNTELATTGYTTIEDGSEFVARLRFTHSPDVTSKGKPTVKFIRTGKSAEHVRVFEIDLALGQLMHLAEEVAFVLAEPVMDYRERGWWTAAQVAQLEEWLKMDTLPLLGD